jgi:hypothetical protein
MGEEAGLVSFPAEPFRSLAEVEAHLGGERVQCLLCGKRFENVLSHVKRTHDLEEREYRDRFNIPAKYSLAGSRLSAVRRAVSSRPEHKAHIAKQRAKRPRTGPMNAMVVEVRPPGKKKIEDFSWHLNEARTVYERIEPPEGVAAWQTFKNRCMVDPELRAEFYHARSLRPVPRETKWARERKRWGGQRAYQLGE